MKTLARPSGARLHRRDEWKTSAYAFVPYETHFGELCGFADDVVAAGRGFGMHPHRDMEISTVMLRGAQRHEDSTGSKHLLDTSSVQTMSAGTGILHSEHNASPTEPFHSYQIWIYPKERGLAPRHETFRYAPEDKQDRWLVALSPDGRGGSARIGQDAFLAVGAFGRDVAAEYTLASPLHGVYVHCAKGEVTVAGVRLGEGDAVGVWETERCDLVAHADSELVLVEVPMARGVRV